MPFMAWTVSEALGLPVELMLGMVLVGSCPGGTASNIICYLAKGEVAVSITLTAVSTLLAIFLTPLLTWLYIGQKVPVPVPAMMLNIFSIVLAPVALGVFINNRFGDRLETVNRIFPVCPWVASSDHRSYRQYREAAALLAAPVIIAVVPAQHIRLERLLPGLAVRLRRACPAHPRDRSGDAEFRPRHCPGRSDEVSAARRTARRGIQYLAQHQRFNAGRLVGQGDEN